MDIEPQQEARFERLKPTQRNMLRCLARGWPIGDIVDTLGYSQTYVKQITCELEHVFGVKSRTELAVLAWHARLSLEPVILPGGQEGCVVTAPGCSASLSGVCG